MDWNLNGLSENAHENAENRFVQPVVQQHAQELDISNSDDEFQPLKQPVEVDEEAEFDHDDPKWIENDVDDLTCTICSNPYHNAGPHQISALKCGHVFGGVCIRKWIDVKKKKKEIPKCPSCKYVLKSRVSRLTKKSSGKEGRHKANLHSESWCIGCCRTFKDEGRIG